MLAGFGTNKSLLSKKKMYKNRRDEIPSNRIHDEGRKKCIYIFVFLAIKYPSQFVQLNFTFADAVTTQLGRGVWNSFIHTS
jgi:hypothetical protein